MSQEPTIPEPSDELATDWANKIISQNKLTDESNLEKISDSIADFVEKEFPEFKVTYTHVDQGVNGFRIRDAKAQIEDPLDWLLPFEDTVDDSEEEKMLRKYISVTYSKLLTLLDIANPSKYNDYLKEWKLRAFKEPPKYRISVFGFWAEKIIKYFNLTDSSNLTTIIKKTLTFFDVLFPDYKVNFLKYKDEAKFPIRIDRIDDDTLMWLSITTKIRRLVFSTHYHILKQFNRIADYPKDPEFWFELVLVYEELGLKNEASEFGDMGLALNPKELIGLTDLVTFYGENKRFIECIKYIKQSGLIFFDKKQYPMALDIWKKVTNFEPLIKENWINLEKVYLAMGNEAEAQECRERIEKLK